MVPSALPSAGSAPVIAEDVVATLPGTLHLMAASTSLALPSTFTHTNTELTNSTANRTSAGTGRRLL